MNSFEMLCKHIKTIEDGESMLSGWLIDNTDEVFEEQPEIDEARLLISEGIAGARREVKDHVTNLIAVRSIVNDYLKDEIAGGFTEFDALEDAIEILSTVIMKMEGKAR